MDGDLNVQRRLWQARVDGVIDQLHHRIRRAAVIGEERGGYFGRYALSNRDPGGAHGKRMWPLSPKINSLCPPRPRNEALTLRSALRRTTAASGLSPNGRPSPA